MKLLVMTLTIKFFFWQLFPKYIQISSKILLALLVTSRFNFFTFRNVYFIHHLTSFILILLYLSSVAVISSKILYLVGQLIVEERTLISSCLQSISQLLGEPEKNP